MNKRILLRRIMSVIMTFVMVLSSLFSTGFMTGITVYAADGDRDLMNVVKNQDLGWNLSNDSGVQTGNADQPIYPYEDIYDLIYDQLEQGLVTIDFTGLNRIDNDHGSGNKKKIWDWLTDIYKDSGKEWDDLSKNGVYGAVLEKDKTYSVKYKGVQLRNGQKVTVEFKITNCSLKPSWNVDTSGSAPHDDDGPYIVFFGNKPGSCRWTGWSKVKCQVSIHDVGNDGALSSPVVGSFSFMDIDQAQAIQIDSGSTPMIMGGKVVENLKVANNDDAYKKHINKHMNGDAKYTFFCANTNNSSDQRTNKKYRLQTDLKFDNANHDFTYWFYAGHQNGLDYTCPGDENCQEANQKYGIFMSFEGGALVDIPESEVNAPPVSKKVNGVDDYYLKNGGEEFTYTLQSTIDPTVHTGTTISQFGWEDTIQNELQYTGAWSVTCNGADVTSQFNANISGQKISVYKTNPADASGTYVVSFKCKIRDGADLSRFVDATGYAKIPNQGEVHFMATKTTTPVKKSNEVHVYYKPPVRPNPEKTVDKETLNTADDSWQYTVSQQIPAQTWLFGPMDAFVITDQIDTCLAVDEVKVFSGSKDVTSQFDVDTSGNLVTATAKKDFLSNTADLTGNHAGTTISMQVKVHIAKKLKDIKQHHPRLTSGKDAAEHLNGTETILTEQNDAQVQIAWDSWKDGWNETKTTNTVTTTVGVPHIQPPTKAVSDNDETDVEANTLTNADEHWTYTITQKIPAKTAWAYRYESFSINDEIDPCLTIDQENIEVLVDGKDQKSNGNFAVTVDENNKVTVTPKASVLDGDDSAVIYGENLSGTTIQVKIPVYIDSKGNEGGSDASNQAVLEMIRAHGHFHTNENGTEDYMTFKNAAYTLVDDMIDEQNTPGRMETDTVTTTVNCPQIAAPEKFVSDKDDLNWDYSVEKGGEDKLLDKNRISDSVNEWIYTIRQDIPEHTAPLYFYKSFVIDDAVDPCLEYNAEDVVVTIGDKEYGRDYFTVEKREDNTLVVTATDAALKDVAFYGDKAGSRIQIQFPVHIKVADPVYDTSGLKAHGHLREDSDKGDAIYEFLNGDDATVTKSTIDNLLKVENNIEGNTTLPDVRRTNSVTTQVEVSEPKGKKKADRFEWEVGEDVKYSITVKDENPYAIMDKVTITDNDLPDSLQLDKDREDSIIVYASGATENYSAPDNSTSIPDPRGPLTEVVTDTSGTAEYSDITKECEVTYYNDQGATGDGFTVVIPKQYRGETVTVTFLCKATENWDNCSYPDTCTNGSVVENTASVYSTLMLNDEPLTSTERVWINTPHLNIQKYTGEWNYEDGEFQRVDEDENQTNYQPGDKVHYTVLVKNSHPGTVARDPVVTDELLDEGLSIDANSIEVHKIRLDENGNPKEKYGETGTTRLTQGVDYLMTTYGGKAFESYFTGRTLRHWGATPFLTAEQYETNGLAVDEVNNGKYETGAADDTKVPGLKRTDEAKYDSERKTENGSIIYREDKAFEDGSLVSADSAWLIDKAYANTWKKYPVGYQTANEKGEDTSDGWESRRTVNHPDEWATADTAYIISYDATITRGISLGNTIRNATYADSENSDYVNTSTLIAFEGAKLQIDKECDKGFGGEYNVGSTGHYSLTVTETQDQVEAKNVVIKDTLNKDEAAILSDTVKVFYFADKSKVKFDESRQAVGGEDITDSCTFPAETNTDHSIYINTNRNLKSTEAIVVTYDVDFSNAALAGQNIPNVAMAKADNAYPELNEYTGFTPVSDSISVRKSSDVYSGTTVKQGEEITYTIAVRNTTGEDLHNILVKDSVPEFSSYVDGSAHVKDSGGVAMQKDGIVYAVIPTLHANQTKELMFKVTVNDNATENDVIYNTAEVYDATDEEISPKESFKDADDITDAIMAIFGSAAFVKTNQTAHPLAYWAVDDNIVHVIANDTSVGKTTDKKVYYVGETIYYTVTLKNNSKDVPLEDLKLDDAMDAADAAVIDENSFKVTLTSNGETKTLDVKPVLNETKTGYHIDFGIDLNYGELVTVTYTAEAQKAVDSLTNTADFSDNKEKHFVADADVKVEDPALRINKTVDPELLQIGQEAQYEIVVNEPTDRGAIKNVTVEDALEQAGLIEIDADSIKVLWNSEDITDSCTITVNESKDGYKVETGRAMTTADELRIQYTGTATKEAAAFCEETEDGFIDNVAAAYGEGTDKVTDTAKVKVTDAALRIDKSVSTSTLQVGEVAAYKVVVNTPNDTAQISNVTIEDALEEAGLIEINADSIKVTWNGEDITGSCAITVNEAKDGYKIETGKTMTVKDTCTITYTGTATEAAPAFCGETADGMIDNTAAAYGDETEKVTDTAQVKVTDPVLRIDKSVAPNVLQVGEEAAYEVVVNTPADNVEIKNVTVEDALEQAGLIEIDADSMKVLWNGDDITEACVITVNEAKDGYKVETGKTMTSADELRIQYTGTALEAAPTFCKETEDGYIDNTATAYGEGTAPVSDTAQVKATDSVLRMDKTVNPNVIQIGGEANYEVTVNTPADNVQIKNIVVEDALEEAGLIEIQTDSMQVLWNQEDITESCTITVNESKDGYKVETGRTMTAKDECKILYTGIATEAAPAFCESTEDGMIDNTATAYGEGTEPISDTAQVKVEDPDNGLFIEKDSDRDVYDVSFPVMIENGTEDIAHYTVKVTNTKDGIARNVVINDQFEKTGMEIDRESIKVEKFDAKTQTTTDVTAAILEKGEDNITLVDTQNGYVIQTHDNLGLSDAFLVSYDVIFTDPTLTDDDVLNHVIATDDNGEEVETDHTVEVKVPELETTKTSDDTKYDVGDVGHYTVTVSNTEEGSIAYNVRIHDELILTDGIEPKIIKDSIKVIGPDGSDITENVTITASDTSYDVDTGMDLAYGETITVTYDVDFSDTGLSGQQVPNTVSVVADNASSESDNQVNLPRDGIQAVKSSDPESGSTVNTGDEITYHITLTNTEDETIQNVMVRDKVPALTEYVSGGTLMQIGGEDYVTFLIDSIEPGQSTTVDFTVKVTGTGYNVIHNVAQFKVAKDDPATHWEDPDFYNTNEVVHYIPYIVTVDNAQLAIEKSSDKDVYEVGETGHYTVKVTETKEDSVAKNVVIKDALQIDGAKILPDTIKITDTDGKDLTRLVADIQADETGYTITTGMDLAYNESFIVTYDVFFESQSLANQTVVNIAKAKADNAEAETDNDVEVPYTEIEEGLEAKKSSDPVSGTRVKNGEKITYHIHVRNTGDADKENILVLDAIPDLTTYVDGSARLEMREESSILAQAKAFLASVAAKLTGEEESMETSPSEEEHLVTINGKEYVSYNIDSLAAGEEATVSFDVIVSDEATEEDTIRNVALVKPADKEDPTNPETWDPDTFIPTNETEHPLGPWVETDDEVDVIAPTLDIVKSSDKDVYLVGETGHYQVVVTQTKEGCTARNLVIKDEMQVNGVKILPETIRVMDPDEKDITEAVKITTTDTSYQIDTGMDLAYNESFTVTYDVTFVEESLAGQQVVNIAKAKADNAQAETENDVTPIITEDGLEVVKSADPVSGTTVKAGDTITYDITVTNTGSAEKENILVLDAIPALTTYVEGSGGTLVTIGDKAYVSFVIPTLSAGASETVSFAVTVSNDATEEDVILNTALVKTADDEDPSKPETWNPDIFVPTNTTEHPLGPWVVTDHTVNVEQPGSPRLLVTKESDKDTYNIGETGTYTITVTNDQADTTAENVVITDAFKTTGMTINQSSIKVTGPDGNAITPASIAMNGSGNGFTIATGTSLAGGQSMTVTYQVTFQDASLAGTDVINHVTAAADNATPADADHTVKIAKQETKDDTKKPDKKDRTQTPDKTTGGSNKGSGSVQTSDILIGVLIAAAATLAVTGGVYYRRKRLAAMHTDFFWRK